MKWLKQNILELEQKLRKQIRKFTDADRKVKSIYKYGRYFHKSKNTHRRIRRKQYSLNTTNVI